jgi:hypothetical protein
MPKKARRVIPNPKPLKSWNYCNPCCAGCLVCIFVAAAVVVVSSYGWYYVHYTDDSEGPVYCFLSLRDCTLSSCHDSDIYTGYQGEGDCSSWNFAIFLFAAATVWGGLYLAFMAGSLHMQHKNWMPFLSTGRYGGCCVDTKVDLGQACPGKVCEGIGPCRGVLPHGCIGAGFPVLMFLGFMMVLNQDMSHFKGVDAGYAWMFYLGLFITLCSCCVVAGLGYDATSNMAARRAKGSAHEGFFAWFDRFLVDLVPDAHLVDPDPSELEQMEAGAPVRPLRPLPTGRPLPGGGALSSTPPRPTTPSRSLPAPATATATAGGGGGRPASPGRFAGLRASVTGMADKAIASVSRKKAPPPALPPKRAVTPPRP